MMQSGSPGHSPDGVPERPMCIGVVRMIRKALRVLRAMQRIFMRAVDEFS